MNESNNPREFLVLFPRVMFFIILAGWIALFFFSSPEALIEYIGVQNGYLLIFLLSFVSGLSVFGLAPYHLVLIALAAGGLAPSLLAVAATLGLAIGDSTSYYLGYQGRAFIPKRYEASIQRVHDFFERHRRFLPIFIFFYGALIPFSNDFVGVTMGLARYPFWRVMVPLTLGTAVFNATLAFGAVYAYGLVESFFR